MPAVEKRTISLPPAQAHYIDALVETGTYASASEVVRAAGCPKAAEMAYSPRRVRDPVRRDASGA